MLSARVCCDPEAKAVICGEKGEVEAEGGVCAVRKGRTIVSDRLQGEQGCPFPCQRGRLPQPRPPLTVFKISVRGLGAALQNRKENGNVSCFLWQK